MGDKRLLSILLIQIRRDRTQLAAERRGFVEHSGLEDHHFTTLDVFRQPDFAPSIIEDYDAIMVGGLSDDASDAIALPSFFDPFIDNLYQLLDHTLAVQKPALLSCGGFMLASMMMGGEVVIDPSLAELGVYKLCLTKTGTKDPLFRDFPESFQAVSGHIKSTRRLPHQCQRLLYSERCPIHGFRVKGTPFYAFQFHPEIKCSELQARVSGYRDKYFDSEEAYLRFLELDADTSFAHRIVTNFVELVRQHSTAG